MYPVSEAYLEAIQKHTVATRWSGKLTTKDGVEYEITPSLIDEGSAKLTRQICPGKDLVIGSTCSAQLDVKLQLGDVSRYTLMEAVLDMTSALRLADGSWEEVPLGVFNITEPPGHGKSTLTIHAYDNMCRFNGEFGETVIGKPYELLMRACSACGVELGTSMDAIMNYPNGNVETWNLADIQIYTWRDLVGFIAAMLCCYAYCGVDGRLYVEPYRMEADRTITPRGRIEYTPTDYECYYTSLTHLFHISQEYEAIVLAGGGLDYDLGENPFLQFNADDVRKSALTAIIQQLSKVRYTPYTAKMRCDPSIMPGDVLEFSGNHAMEGKLAAVTKQVLTLHGGMTIECCGDDPNLNVLTEQEKRIRAAAKSANKDGMFYYDFENAAPLHIGAGERARVIVFHYTTTKRTHVDFHAELKCKVDILEDYDEGTDTYIERDGVVEVTYLEGGNEIKTYYPVDLLTDGTQLMHLLYTWWASANIISSFEVHIKCVGCSITCEAGEIRGYMAGPGLVGEVGKDGAVYIYDDFAPVDFAITRKKFTGSLVPTLDTPVGSSLLDNVTVHNFFKVMSKRFGADLIPHESLRFAAIYDYTIVDTENVTYNGSVWVNAVKDVDGTVTSPEMHVPRIISANSKHTSNTGDVSYCVSFDGGETWYTWADGWTLYEEGYGMVESMMVSIPRDAWKVMLEPHGTIMLRAILEADASLADMQFITTQARDWSSSSHLKVECQEYYIIKSRDRTELRYEYLYQSEEAPIDVGRLSKVDIDTTIYSEVIEIYAHARKTGV